MKRVTAFILLGCALLVSAVPATAQVQNSTENMRHERVLLPVSVPNRGCMTVFQTLTFIEEEFGSGTLVFYDDPRTPRPIDYIELYDFEGDLLIIGWIDPLGVCQAAMDSGLLDADDPRIDGVLVVVPIGTML